MPFDLASAKPVSTGGFDLSSAKPVNQDGAPGPRAEPAGLLTKFGRSAASLADVTVGGVIPAIVQQVTYPVARVFGQTPEEATALTGKVVGAIDQPVGKAFGVTQTPEYQNEAGRKIMDFVGQNITKGSKWISEKTGMPEADVTYMIGTLTLAAPGAVRAAAPIVPAIKQGVQTGVEAARATKVGQAIESPIKARQAATQAKNVARSYANATKIEAAQVANKLGVALNPAESNPTLGNKLTAVTTGNKNINASLAKVNEGRWTDIVKEDLGVPTEGRLNAASIENALDVASKPYDAVRVLPKMEPSGEVLASIRDISKPATIGGKAKADAVNTLVNETVDALREGRSGVQVIDDIRQLRRDAQSVYKARDKGNNPPPADVAAADAKMTIADSLERMIDEHAPNPQVLSEFQAARQRMAQIYDHERAIDYGTNKVDPQVYAKLLDERKGNMSGVGADIGKVAANFPEVSRVGEKYVPSWQQELTRSGVAGTLGYAAGSVVGSPVAGAVVGAATGKVASALAAKRIASPAYQASHAVPRDYRPPVNMLRPVEPGASNLAVYDWANAMVRPEDMPYRPNWTYGRPTPDITVGPQPQMPLRIGQGGTIESLRAEDVRRGAMSRTLGQEAEMRQAAAESVGRKPASGEVILDFDPITGKFREASQGVKGATPEVWQANLGASLKSASEKIASGQTFAMDAAEMAAWNKTSVDLVEIMPGFRTMEPKVLAQRMQDREWVANAVVKAREKATAFEKIAARASEERAKQTALMNRERMIEFAEQLEAQFRKPTSKPFVSQGPKTRAHQRNALTNNRNQNALNE